MQDINTNSVENVLRNDDNLRHCSFYHLEAGLFYTAYNVIYPVYKASHLSYKLLKNCFHDDFSNGISGLTQELLEIIAYAALFYVIPTPAKMIMAVSPTILGFASLLTYEIYNQKIFFNNEINENSFDGFMDFDNSIDFNDFIDQEIFDAIIGNRWNVPCIGNAAVNYQIIHLNDVN
jgi:hypothetical protein